MTLHMSNLSFSMSRKEMLHNQARETHALPIVSYPVQSHDSNITAALPLPSHSITPAQHLLTPPKHIKTNPSNSDIGISSLSISCSETFAEMQVVVQTMTRQDSTGGGGKWGSGKGE
jgi:hypothetical protein